MTRRRDSVRAHSALPAVARGSGRLAASQRSTAACDRPPGAAGRPGPGLPAPIAGAVDSDDRQDLGRRADQDHLVGGHELVERDPASSANGMPSVADEPEDELRVVPGRMPWPSGVPSSRPPRTQSTEVCVASVTSPSASTRIASNAPGAAGGLDRQDVGQQVRRLDVAPLPAEVGMADHRHARPAGAGRSARRRRAGPRSARWAAPAGRGTDAPRRHAPGDLDVDRPLLDPARRDRLVDPSHQPGQVVRPRSPAPSRLRSSRARCSSSSQQRPW